MPISPLKDVLDSLAGMPVRQTNLIGNQLRIWFNFSGSDEQAISLITDVPWRIEHNGVTVMTSAEIPWEADAHESHLDFKKRHQDATVKSSMIVGKIVVCAAIDSGTRDLSLTFSDGLLLRSFTVRRDDEITVVHLHAENRRLALM